MPPPDEHELLDLIYRAGIEPEEFPALLRGLAEAFSAEAANCNVLDARLENANLCATHGIAPEHVRSYAEYFGERDEWRLGARRHGMSPAVVYRGPQLVTDAALARSEFHADYLARLDLFHWCGARIARWEGGEAVISLQRARRRGPFSTEEVRRLQQLVPHLARAVRLSRTLADVRREAAAWRGLADGDPVGFLLVEGATGRLVSANPRGEALLRDGSALTVREGRVAARRPGDDARLAALLAAAAGRDDTGAASAESHLAIPRPDSPRPLLVTLVARPLPEAALAPASVRLVALQVVDPDLRIPVPESLLRHWLGLTPSEARLARLLADGEPLARAADALRLTQGSARQYLKRIFRKTGCHRQSELVRAILSAGRCSRPPAG